MNEYINTIQDILQLVSIPILIWIIWLFCKWTSRNYLRMKWSVPALTWVGHSLIFYVYIQLAHVFPLVTGFFGFWNTIVKFHGTIVILVTIWTLYKLNGRLGK